MRLASEENSTESASISVQGLVKSFDGKPVLRKLDLQVRPGERYVLFGSNGSGKTTLLKSLAGIARPDEGTIRILGLDTRTHGPILRQHIGFVTHQPLLYEDLTGWENLRFYGRMYQVANLNHRIKVIGQQLEVGRSLDQRVRTLSHGMKKRLAIARALLHDPSILLLDEPEAGLDEVALSLLDKTVFSREETNRTILMTTHSLERGLQFGNRIGFLTRGRLTYEKPRDESNLTELREIFHMYKDSPP